MVLTRRGFLASAAIVAAGRPALAAPKTKVVIGVDGSCPVCASWLMHHEARIRADYKNADISFEYGRQYNGNPTLLVNGARVTKYT
jgi:hypothetical protein